MIGANPVTEKNSAEAGGSGLEIKKGGVESLIETGGVQAVYQHALGEAEDAIKEAMLISQVDPAVATIAGPEVVALKTADHELAEESKVAVKKLEEAIVPAKDVAPLTEEPEVITESLSEAESVESGEHVEQIEHIQQELTAERKALKEFIDPHGKAYTKIEQSYLDALNGRISALEFEEKTLSEGSSSEEKTKKIEELKKRADEAEAAYQAMYEAAMKQPVEVQQEKPAVAAEEVDDSDHQYYAGGYHSSPSFGSSESSPTLPAGKSSSYGGESMNTQKPKGRIGKFIDGLKFWKYFTGK